MPEKTEVEYNRAQFEAAYRAIVQCSHAIRHIDVKEVRRWINKVIAEQEVDETRRDALNKLMKLIDAFDRLRETMKETGVPRQPPLVQEVPAGKPQ